MDHRTPDGNGVVPMPVCNKKWAKQNFNYTKQRFY